MSGGTVCYCGGRTRNTWRVVTRRGNYSLFNGGRLTPSDYSEVRCTECGARWRTKADYVDRTPDA